MLVAKACDDARLLELEVVRERRLTRVVVEEAPGEEDADRQDQEHRREREERDHAEPGGDESSPGARRRCAPGDLGGGSGGQPASSVSDGLGWFRPTAPAPRS